MFRGEAKMSESFQQQDTHEIFALDIGTRSIIGVFGRMEDKRLHVLDIEKETHDQRAMLDGQIEDIGKVADVARTVVQKVESKLKKKLSRVCVAAAGRALKSERASFTLDLGDVQQATDDIIGQLEAGAVSEAERVIIELPDQQHNQFYMVGYTVAQYRVDGYPMSNLLGHSGKVFEADVVATFLPREVIESLYSVVAKIGLEVASVTLEPIASLNAAIPADIRLLNLALVDIGAGTSDIAVCREGSVAGYTMATVAGDEVTELLMRSLLVDFQTGERLKMEMDKDVPVRYTDILGLPHAVEVSELRETIQPAAQLLAQEISSRILELNGRAPSAVFLAGGGSKLDGLKTKVAEGLQIDDKRVAIAGNHFERNAYSDEFDINDPEFATPLGIAISAAMGLINDSYVVTLNGEPAKLFRSGALNLRDILMMNGCRYSDIIGRSGANLTVMLNGERKFFRGEPATPPVLVINGETANLSDVIRAGDNIRFIPAKSGKDARRTIAELVGKDFVGQVTVNGAVASMDDVVHTGDEIWADSSAKPPKNEEISNMGPGLNPPGHKDGPPIEQHEPPEVKQENDAEPTVTGENKPQGNKLISVKLNGAEIKLGAKSNNEPYYLMDLLEYTGIDFDHLDKAVDLMVNGEPGQFSQILHENDDVVIE